MSSGDPLIPLYRELEIRDAASAYEELGTQIEARLARPWRRDRERETEERLVLSAYQIFSREKQVERPALLLFLLTNNGDVYVPNIVPTDRDKISRNEYNRTIEEFADDFARPAAEALNFSVVLGPTHLDLSDELDESTYKALRQFSRTSNRSSGSSHPSDREIWMEFLCSLLESGCDLSTGHLEEWLVLDGWAEETAFELALEFEFGMTLLRHGQHR